MSTTYHCPKCGTEQPTAGALLGHIGSKDCTYTALNAGKAQAEGRLVALPAGGTVVSLDGRLRGELVHLECVPRPGGQRRAVQPRHGDGLYLVVTLDGQLIDYCGTTEEIRAHFPERDVIDRLARRQRGSVARIRE
jgi:hypothetical protein